MNRIKQSHLFNEKIKFEINDTYDDIAKASKAKLDLFQFSSISNYKKILYLDTDILIKDDINKAFNIIEDDILYVLEEGTIDDNNDKWGKTLFDVEIENFDDKTAFTTGILLFNNCEKMKDLFDKIKEDIIIRPYNFSCLDQPYIVYNAFKYNLYNNKKLKKFAVNNDKNYHSDKVIHHFPGNSEIYDDSGNIGVYYYSGNAAVCNNKIKCMSVFLYNLKDYTIVINIAIAKKFITDNLLQIINNCGELLEGNIFMWHNTTDYTDVYLNKSKNISNLVLNKNIKKVMEVGFNSGFSTLLMLISNRNITVNCFDLGEHAYMLPCYNKIKEFFGDRLNLTVGDSTKTLPEINDTYDLIHIDGGHCDEVANSDIINSYRLSKHRTILIMDDYDFPNLHDLWDSYITNYGLKPLDIHTYDTDQHDIKVVINVHSEIVPVMGQFS